MRTPGTLSYPEHTVYAGGKLLSRKGASSYHGYLIGDSVVELGHIIFESHTGELHTCKKEFFKNEIQS